ncbi:MAG: N-acetylmuramoyl-L-alanine amidase [Deltaproteobacteria bacterium]
MRVRPALFRFLCAAALGTVAGCASVARPPGTEPTDIVYATHVPAGLPRGDTTHIIGPAETVYRISKMYDVPIKTILDANAIKDPRDLRIGQKLLIPGAAPLRPVIPVFRPGKWRYIVIHHSVTDNGDATSLDVIHRRRGFDRGLGYHFVIDNGTTTRVDGQIEASPRWIKQMDGAHCNAGGMNQCGIGICLVGDFTHHEPTRAQMDSLVLLVNTLRKHYHIPLNRIIGHRDVPGKNTACPGDSFPWTEFKKRLRRGH